MKKDVDYNFIKDHSVPYGCRIRLKTGRFSGFCCHFDDVRLEEGKIKFGYTPETLEVEVDPMRDYDVTDPRLQEALKEVLRDINNTLGDIFYS